MHLNVLLISIVSVIIAIQSRVLCHEDHDSIYSFTEHFMSNVSNQDFSKIFLPNYVDFKKDVNDNLFLQKQCRSAMSTVLSGLELRQIWAVMLFNSWGHFPPSGLVQGTLVDFGDYDQCVRVYEGSPERPKYCLVDIAIPMPSTIPPGHNLFNKETNILPQLATTYYNIPMRDSLYEHLAHNAAAFYYDFIQIGICLPAKCTQLDARAMLNQSTISEFGFNLKTITCNTADDYWNFNLIQLVAIIFLASMCFLSIIAIIYDSFNDSKSEGSIVKKSDNFNWLTWFSPVRNVRKLMCTKSGEDDLGCVHGIRVITIVWIVIGHGLDWNKMNSFRDTFTIRDRVTEIGTQPLFRTLLTVDSFFFLSGMLNSYTNLKYTKGKYENFSTWKYVLLRYLRLTPHLASWMLLTLLLPALFDGPLWKRYIAMLEPCYHNWWLNLFYIQNVVDVPNICGLHTWYIATDMQLHWIALIPVIVWLRNRAIGRQLIGGLIALSITISSTVLYVKKFPPGSVLTSRNDIFNENGKPTDFLQFVYNPSTHVPVFLIGFLFGDLLKHKEDHLKQITYNLHSKLLLWLASIGSFGIAIYSVYPWVLGRPYDPLWSSILFPMNLLAWTLGMSLTIWLCVTRNGGFIGRILSSRVLRPLSRMTYSVYLTHVWVVWIVLGSRRHLIDLHVNSIVLLFATLITLSFVVGFLFTVLFESPLICAVNSLKHNLFIAQNRDKTDRNRLQQKVYQSSQRSPVQYS